MLETIGSVLLLLVGLRVSTGIINAIAYMCGLDTKDF